MSPHQTKRFVLFWLSHITQTSISQLNQYTESTGLNGEYLWQSTSDFIPVQSQSFGEIKIGDEMSAEFDFVWGGRTNDPSQDKYEMFFRIGYDSALGNSCSGQGSRYPSFWISKDSDTMHLSTSHGSTCQPSQSLSEYGIINKHIPYHILIAFNSSALSVHISGGDRANFSKHWSREPTKSNHIGTMAQIWWMSGKYGQTEYNRGNGTFSNVVITSKIHTDSPTTNPTSPPSTGSPSISPTPNPTRFPTENPTPSPTHSPTPFPSVSPSYTPTVGPTLYNETSIKGGAHVFSSSSTSTSPDDDDEVIFVPEDNELHDRVEATFFSGDMLYITMAAIGCMVLCCCLILVFCVKLKQQEMVKKRTQRRVVMSRSSSPYSNSIHSGPSTGPSHIVATYSDHRGDRHRSYSGHYGSAHYGSGRSVPYGSAHYGSSTHYASGYGSSTHPVHHKWSQSVHQQEQRPRYFSADQPPPQMVPMGTAGTQSHQYSTEHIQVSQQRQSRPSSETSLADPAMNGMVYDFRPNPNVNPNGKSPRKSLPLSPPPILTGPEMMYYSKAQKREILRTRSKTPKLPPPPRHHHSNTYQTDRTYRTDRSGVSNGVTPVDEYHDDLPPGSPRSPRVESQDSDEMVVDDMVTIGHLEVPEERNTLMMHHEDGSNGDIHSDGSHQF